MKPVVGRAVLATCAWLLLSGAGLWDNRRTEEYDGLHIGGSGIDVGTGGNVRLEHQGAGDALLQLFSDLDWDGGGDQSRGLFHLENTNVGSTGGMLSIQNVCNNSSGSCFEIRIDGNGPDIEFIEDDASPSHTGKYELAVQGQFFELNSRNAADNSFANLIRVLGGFFSDGGSAPTGNANVTRMELHGSPNSAASSHRDSPRFRLIAKYDNAGTWSSADVWDLLSDQTGASASSNTFKLMDHGGTVVLQATQTGERVEFPSGFTVGAGTEITKHLSATATLDFASQGAAGCEELTVSVTGAVAGDACAVGVPTASNVANSIFNCRVSGADTVSVKHCTVTSGNPASGSFRVAVWQH